MTELAAILWDVDGTLAETERDGHRVAFNLAFEKLALPWRWSIERYGELLHVAGGRERLIADLETQPGAPDDPGEREALATEVHRLKNSYYADLVRERAISLRPGVAEMFDECESRGVPMGITTTTSRSNLDALMTVNLGPGWQARFAAIVNGEDVARKKPDPEVYEKAVTGMNVSRDKAVAVEDTPDGVAAARDAGVPVIVARSSYFSDVAIDGAIAIGPGLESRAGWVPRAAGDTGRVTLDDIANWLEQSRNLASPGRPKAGTD